MRTNIPSRPAIGAGLTLLVGLVVASCSNTVSVGPPEEPGPTGFEGDWIGTFQGSEMILRIGDFGFGNQSTGQVIWRDVEWDLVCSVIITPERSDIECDVEPSAEVAFCGDPDPFVDIESSEPNQRLEASVGGLIREGAGDPCDGPVLVSWEPTEGVIFVQP